MKKIFFLICCIGILSSCSKDNNNNSNGNDAIIGKWYLAEINNSGSLNLTPNDCNKNSYIDFKSNNTADSAYFSDDSGSCTQESSDNSAWENLGNSRYKFVIPYKDIGAQSGKVEFNGSNSFTFYPDLLSAQGTTLVFEKR